VVEVTRGDVVVVAFPGDYGKPRPAVVIQSDRYGQDFESVLLCPLTSAIVQRPALRVPVEPSELNKLKTSSDVMIEKIMAVHRTRIAQVVGRIDDDTMSWINRSLSLILDLR
jgi:mRNA interferase MazF